MSDERTILALVSSLKNSIYEESKNRKLLIPFIDEIELAIAAKHFSEALRLTDELEDFMDLEFCSS